jgi:hypothetical protein
MRKTVVLCDLDDSDNPRPGVAVIEMSMDGVLYPLDVCEEHFHLLKTLPRDKAEPSSAGARTRAAAAAGAKATTRPGSRTSSSKAPAKSARKARPAKESAKPSGKQQSRRQPTSRRSRQARIALARDWARSQGREVSDRGRLPAGLLEEFEAAHR